MNKIVKKYVYEYNMLIGKVIIQEDGIGITKIEIKNSDELSNRLDQSIECEVKQTELIKRAYIQLDEYLKGERKQFNIPLSINGTSFQNKVWEELRKIPYGMTVSYKYIAEKVGCPKGARAIGMANNKNKIMIMIPCHRVIGSNNKLVGYASGLDVKEKLLQIEKLK